MQGLKRRTMELRPKTFSNANAREPQELTCFEGALKYRCKVVLQGMGFCLKRIFLYIQYCWWKKSGTSWGWLFLPLFARFPIFFRWLLFRISFINGIICETCDAFSSALPGRSSTLPCWNLSSTPWSSGTTWISPTTEAPMMLLRLGPNPPSHHLRRQVVFLLVFQGLREETSHFNIWVPINHVLKNNKSLWF